MDLLRGLFSVTIIGAVTITPACSKKNATSECFGDDDCGELGNCINGVCEFDGVHSSQNVATNENINSSTDLEVGSSKQNIQKDAVEALDSDTQLNVKKPPVPVPESEGTDTQSSNLFEEQGEEVHSGSGDLDSVLPSPPSKDSASASSNQAQTDTFIEASGVETDTAPHDEDVDFNHGTGFQTDSDTGFQTDSGVDAGLEGDSGYGKLPSSHTDTEPIIDTGSGTDTAPVFDAGFGMDAGLQLETLLIEVSKDTHIRADVLVRINDNYGCGIAMAITRGRDIYTGFPIGAPGASRGLIQFELGDFSKYVSRATLELQVFRVNRYTDPEDMRLDVYAILPGEDVTAWEEGNGAEETMRPWGCVEVDDAPGVAWVGMQTNSMSRPPLSDQPIDSREFEAEEAPAVGDVITWDVTEVVREWVSGERENHGFAVQEGLWGNDFHEVFISTKEGETYPFSPEEDDRPGQIIGPRLRIEYQP